MQHMSRNRKSQKEGEKVNLSTVDVSNLIDAWIFNERNRQIIKRRLIDHAHFEPLAEEFRLSVRQVKNIVYDGESIIYSHI